MTTTILLVEDDTVLRFGLSELFTREGYTVIQAASAREAREKLTEATELIVLDVSLPDDDGVTLCRSWRDSGVTQPILFLTAKDEEEDIVTALDAGGNDYMTKPFGMKELLSRVRVQLRGKAATPVSHGRFDVDAANMQVKKDGETLNLTLTEYKVLILLMNSRAVVTRDQIYEVLWNDGAKFVDDNTLSVHISRLREKIGAEHIRTVRGVGYQWQD